MRSSAFNNSACTPRECWHNLIDIDRAVRRGKEIFDAVKDLGCTCLATRPLVALVPRD